MTDRAPATLLALFALAGCGAGPDAQPSQQGLYLSSVTQSVCAGDDGPPSFDIAIYPAPEGGCPDDPAALSGAIVSENIALTELVDVSELELGTDGSALDLSGLWVGGDGFFLLEPDDYCVTATPVGGDPSISPNPAYNKDVTVSAGATSETVFAFTCDGTTIGALDIVVIVNEGPSIVDFGYGPSGKFVNACESGAMTVTYESPQTEAITVSFQLFDALQPGYPGPDAATGWLLEDTQTQDALAGGVYEATWAPAVPSSGTYYVYITITNSAGQQTSFQALLHVYTPPAGVCAADDFDLALEGYRTPEPQQSGTLRVEPGYDVDGAGELVGVQLQFPSLTVARDPFDPSVGVATFGAFGDDLFGAPASALLLGEVEPHAGGPSELVLTPLVALDAQRTFAWPTLGNPTPAGTWTFESLAPSGQPTTQVTLSGVYAVVSAAGEVSFGFAQPGFLLSSPHGQVAGRDTGDIVNHVPIFADAWSLALEGDVPVGMLSCDPSDWTLLNAECVAEWDLEPCSAICEQP